MCQLNPRQRRLMFWCQLSLRQRRRLILWSVVYFSLCCCGLQLCIARIRVYQECPTYGPRATIWTARHFYPARQVSLISGGAKGFSLTSNISLIIGNVTKIFHCFMPLSDLCKFPLPPIPILLPLWGHSSPSPTPEKFVVLCFIGCETPNPGRD